MYMYLYIYIFVCVCIELVAHSDVLTDVGTWAASHA